MKTPKFPIFPILHNHEVLENHEVLATEREPEGQAKRSKIAKQKSATGRCAVPKALRLFPNESKFSSIQSESSENSENSETSE